MSEEVKTEEKATGRGGKRPGSGRKKGSVGTHTLEAAAFRQELVARVIAERGALIEAMIEKAKKGDVFAFKEIAERVLGKVTQPVDFGKDTLKAIQDTMQAILTAKEKVK